MLLTKILLPCKRNIYMKKGDTLEPYNRRKTYSRGYNCRTHNYNTTEEGIKNHVGKLEDEFGVGNAGCDIVQVYYPNERKGSDRGRFIQEAPAIVGRMIKAGILDKNLKWVNRTEFKNAISDQDWLRKCGIIPLNSNCGSMIGESFNCPVKDCKGRHCNHNFAGEVEEPYPSFGKAQKIGTAEKMTEGWMKGMIALNHLPDKESREKFFEKALERLG